MVGTGRVELPTSRLSVVRSNQLSYAPVFIYIGRNSWMVMQYPPETSLERR